MRGHRGKPGSTGIGGIHILKCGSIFNFLGHYSTSAVMASAAMASARIRAMFLVLLGIRRRVGTSSPNSATMLRTVAWLHLITVATARWGVWGWLFPRRGVALHHRHRQVLVPENTAATPTCGTSS